MPRIVEPMTPDRLLRRRAERFGRDLAAFYSLPVFRHMAAIERRLVEVAEEFRARRARRRARLMLWITRSLRRER